MDEQVKAMSLLYCLYNNKKYKAKYQNGVVKITTDVKEQGFTNYIDVLGREHYDLFVKEFSLQDVDVENGKFVIFTDSAKTAQLYAFEKKEQFVFLKQISTDEIESIKIIQKPIKEFADSICENIIIEKEGVSEWLASLKL